MRPRRCEPARFLDARPLYFRPGLESASNSIILVSRIPLLSAYPQPSCGSVVYSYEARRREGQADRQIAAFHDQGPKISSSFLFEETEGRGM